MKLSLFAFILIFLTYNLPNSHANAAELTQVLQQAIKEQHIKPFETITLLEQNHHFTQSAEDQTCFEYYRLLIRLYLKVGRLDKLDPLNTSIHQRFKQRPQYKNWLTIFDAYMLFSKQKNYEARKTILDLQSQLNADAPPELNMWLEYLNGLSDSRQNHNDKAIEHFNAALTLAKKLNSKTTEISINSELSNMYYYMQDYDQSLDITYQSMRIAEELNDEFYVLAAKSAIMNIYYMKYIQATNEAPSASGQEQAIIEEKAQTYAEKSDKLMQEILQRSARVGAFKVEMRALIMLQNQQLRKELFTDVIETGNKVVDIATQHNVSYEKAVALNNISIAHRAMKQHDESIAALQKAEVLYKEIESEQSLIWVLEDYSIAYELNGDFEKALDYQKQLREASLQLVRKTNSEKVIELQALYEHDKNLAEIEKLNQQNKVKQAALETQKIKNNSFIGFGVLLCIIIFSIYSRARVISTKNQKLDALNDKLKQQALKDPLTGLYNRRLLNEIQNKISSACIRRFIKEPSNRLRIGLALFDIDFFKKVNDTYGHDVGDDVIQEFSNDLLANLRDGDIAIRWGGEEFLVVLFDTDREGMRNYITRFLKTRNEKKIDLAADSSIITASAGYALFPLSPEQPDWLTWNQSLKIIDNFLYLAKRKGRNCAVSVIPELNNINDKTKQFLVEGIINDSDNIPNELELEILRHQ